MLSAGVLRMPIAVHAAYGKLRAASDTVTVCG
jgi:hypothetical protein